jgi:hypothetical protein
LFDAISSFNGNVINSDITLEVENTPDVGLGKARGGQQDNSKGKMPRISCLGLGLAKGKGYLEKLFWL